MTVINAPIKYNVDKASYKVFLAGTIDNGSSDNWQDEVIQSLQKLDDCDNVTIFNPRRDKWITDASDKEQRDQITWELERLEESDLIVMNILPDSKSPISLMEIGLYAHSKKIIVICPPEFYRFNNVYMVCTKYKIPLYYYAEPEHIANYIVSNTI